MNKISRLLKRLFIPHIHNDYKPHFLREASVFGVLIVAVVLVSVSLGSKIYIGKTNMTATVLPAVLVDLTNNVRTSNNEATLKRSPLLDQAAKLKAEDMAKYGYFAHTSPTGVTPWYWFGKVGYNFVYAGENLAINFTESSDVENAWINSPTHKANLLNTKFTEIGIATQDGYYDGKPTTYVVQMFGSPIFDSGTSVSPNEVKTQPVENKVVVKNSHTNELKNVLADSKTTLPVVKGASAEVKPDSLKTISDTKEFIAVQNTSVDNVASNSISQNTDNTNTKYSRWIDRLMFRIPNYTNKIYAVLASVIFIALLLTVFIEVKRKHVSGVIYAVSLILLILLFICLNNLF